MSPLPIPRSNNARHACLTVRSGEKPKFVFNSISPVWLIAAFISMRLAITCCGDESAPPEYNQQVAPILAKYCVGCHNADDREGELSLASYAELVQGGGRGAILVPGRADASYMIRALAGEVEPAMPPEGHPRPEEADLLLLRTWIDAGAKGPDGVQAEFPEIAAPKITPSSRSRELLTSFTASPDGRRLAVGRYRHVDLIDPSTRKVLASTPALAGKINRIHFDNNGTVIVAASGIPGLNGEATICRADDGAIVSQVKGHRDAVYDARLSPDGKMLATCGYDRQIHLWDPATGRLVKTLSGHNAAVFEVSFSPDGSVLASASADGTIKVWNVVTGERLDTLGQPEGEQSAVAISPNSEWIVAGGADRQVRMWRLVARERPGINPLVISRRSHKSPIVELEFSPDGSRLVTASSGRELMLWDAATLTPIQDYDQQPELVTGIAFDPNGRGFHVARIDGSWQHFEINAESYAQDAEAPPLLGAKKLGATAASEATAASSATAPAPAHEPPRYEGTEAEPNDTPLTSNEITANALVHGVVGGSGDSAADVDLFRFPGRRGERLVVEIIASRQKSPLDSKLEVLDDHGNPIPRVLLQAVRESYFTFRGRNSTDLSDFRLHGWEDMELNDYLYANGEVVKLWMYPRGPDSGFLVYPGVSGERVTFFGSTAITHALNEPCYIVAPHSPGVSLIDNGLPQYTLYHENDDDGSRKLGTDSRVMFIVPRDGDYLARVSDVRGHGGDDHRYDLLIRAQRPDVHIRVEAPELTIGSGSGVEFAVVAEREDDFDGEIQVEVAGLPPGFHISSPLVIEAGQTTAYAAITADLDAPQPSAENGKGTRLIASAVVDGVKITKDEVSLGEIKLAESPKFLVQVKPSSEALARGNAKVGQDEHSLELWISPGETISATIQIDRRGFDGEISFGTEHSGRNLPHGVYVDNIGLNGITLLQGETRREFFITAARRVPETDRPFHLRAEIEGHPTSWPVMLHVRRPAAPASTVGGLPSVSHQAK